MQQECLYNPARDVEPVAKEGYLDLAKAYASNSVPALMESQASDYNDIDDPASIVGKPSDVFDALSAEKIIKERSKTEPEG